MHILQWILATSNNTLVHQLELKWRPLHVLVYCMDRGLNNRQRTIWCCFLKCILARLLSFNAVAGPTIRHIHPRISPFGRCESPIGRNAVLSTRRCIRLHSLTYYLGSLMSLTGSSKHATKVISVEREPSVSTLYEYNIMILDCVLLCFYCTGNRHWK